VRQATLVERLRSLGNEETPSAEDGSTDSVFSPQSTSDLPPPLPVLNPTPQSLKILLAEDNPINALLTRELLRRRGHHVTEVVSGEEAIIAIQADTFDLLLTDIHMPGLDGVEATRRIRAWETKMGRKRTPIAALTADVLETGRKACRDAGMDVFLTKPVDPAELDAMLAHLFSPREESRLRHAAA